MSKSIAELAAHPFRAAVIVAIALAALLVAAMNVGAAPASNFMEGGSTGGDKDVRASAAIPGFDWANTGPTSSSSTAGCLSTFSAVAGFTTVNLSGTEGLFNCGQGDGANTTPIAPVPTADGTVGAHHIDASAFKVDPLAGDNDTCGVPQTQDGDPTTYTKTGGEKN